MKSQQELEECREEKRMMAEEKDEAIDEYKQQCTKLQEKVKIAYSEVNISFSLPLSFFSSLVPSYTCAYIQCNYVFERTSESHLPCINQRNET